MNKQETTQIITLLAGNYNAISDKTKEQKMMMLNTWYECLKDLEYQLVLNAVKKTIIDSPYPPTIHDVRKNAVEIANPITIKSPIEAWQEAYKMICSGTYMTKDEFNSHTEEVKRFFGSVENLRSYSSNEDFNIDVVRSNFLKQYERIEKNVKEINLMPQEMKTLIQKTGLLEIGE